MTPRISGHCSIFSLVFFVLKSLKGITRQWSLEKIAILTLKPRSHVRILIYRTWAINRLLPSSKNPHFQNEARCTTFLVKMSFICMRMKNDFHIKGWAPTLVLKQRPGGTRKWPIQVFKSPQERDPDFGIRENYACKIRNRGLWNLEYRSRKPE